MQYAQPYKKSYNPLQANIFARRFHEDFTWSSSSSNPTTGTNSCNRGLQLDLTKARVARTSHMPIKTNEWRKANTNETRKRRQRACIVCSVLKDAAVARGEDTFFHCGECKLKTSSKHV
ncbi:hypothetical protein PHMEG_0008787 [Phytophthora megakarya]|uniref:PiggyBac transposable element-derived protein domain-containing protein n=1 Tax=Phytophthora megakarya TaxID=4795 RepID=A0A225WKB4_9STRA|nr:hypothetical protein PHMEG_0008787 [Phytophthora megakarya]